MKQGTSIRYVDNFTTELKTVVDIDNCLMLREISSCYVCCLRCRCIRC